MQYADADPVLLPWANERGLCVTKRYRDAETRSMTIVSARCDSYAIWLEPTPAGFNVSAALNRTQPRTSHRKLSRYRCHLETTPATFRDALDHARDQIVEWIERRGDSYHGSAFGPRS